MKPNHAQLRLRKKWLPPPGETELLKAALTALTWRRRDVEVWRNNTGGMHRGSQYIPFGLGEGGADLIGVLRTGRFWAVELKTEDGRLSEAQRTWHARVIVMGGYVATARTIPEVMRALDAALRGDPSPPVEA